MPELIAIAYPEETVAGQAAQELRRCATDLAIDPDAIGVVICERGGRFQLLINRMPDAPAAWSAFWGSLLGRVLDSDVPDAVTERFRDRIKMLLGPGTSALFVAIDDVASETVLAALTQYGREALRSTVGADTTKGLFARHAA